MISTTDLKAIQELAKHASPDTIAANPELFGVLGASYAARPSTAPAIPVASEHDEQAALFQLADYHTGQYPALALLHAIPNGQYRSGTRAEPGLKGGVPDICCPHPRRGYAGFYGELKVGNNTPSPSQTNWLYALEKQGYYCTVQWGAEAMWQQLLGYVQMPPPLDVERIRQTAVRLNVTIRMLGKSHDLAPLLRQWQELQELLT